jgi:hypothetical protein
MASGRDLAEVQSRAFDRTSDFAAVCTSPDGTLVDVNESFLPSPVTHVTTSSVTTRRG